MRRGDLFRTSHRTLGHQGRRDQLTRFSWKRQARGCQVERCRVADVGSKASRVYLPRGAYLDAAQLGLFLYGVAPQYRLLGLLGLLVSIDAD